MPAGDGGGDGGGDCEYSDGGGDGGGDGDGDGEALYACRPQRDVAREPWGVSVVVGE